VPRVIAIGGANADIKGRSRGTFVARTSNPGEVIVSPGGVARNIAENLARLGLAVSLLTVVGDDANGQLVRESCAAAGIDPAMIATGRAPTGVYLAILDDRGELTAAINDMRAADLLTPDRLEDRAGSLGQADMLVADCNLPVASLAWLCRFSHERAIPLVIDPISVPKARKLLQFERPAPVFAITPNLQQLEALTGSAAADIAIPLLHRLGFANIVVHCGPDGAVISDGDGEPRRISAFPADHVADVTGAGDAAVSGLVCGLVSGHNLADAARLGQAAAAIKLKSRNSAAPGLSQLAMFALAGLPGDP